MFLKALLLLLIPMFASATPLFVAHRGIPNERLENTLASFELAWERGAEAIEGDFRLTRDGHLVCFHDEDTQRLSDTNHIISRSSLKDIRRLRLNDGSQIPTINEVLATVPAGKRIYIEIKDGPECIPALDTSIHGSGLDHEQIVVISFDRAVIRDIKTRHPRIKAFWICSFKKSGVFKRRPSIARVLDRLHACGADGLSTSQRIRESEIKAILDGGFEFHIWTLNDVISARRFAALGALSITSDDAPGLSLTFSAAAP